MTSEDLQRIEQELGITLPAIYRDAMSSFPVPACAGNSDTELWDDAQRLIEVNKQLLAGEYYSAKAWPSHLFCLGIDHGGCAYAMDLRSPDAHVYWVDRCHADSIDESAISEDSEDDRFVVWVRDYATETQVELEEHGVDPSATPKERQRIMDESTSGGCFFWLVVVPVVFVLVLFGVTMVIGIAQILVRRLFQ